MQLAAIIKTLSSTYIVSHLDSFKTLLNTLCMHGYVSASAELYKHHSLHQEEHPFITMCKKVSTKVAVGIASHYIQNGLVVTIFVAIVIIVIWFYRTNTTVSMH